MILTILSTTIVLIMSLFLFEVYKSNEDKIACWADALRKNKTLIAWLIFMCDTVIVASQGIVTISLVAAGILLAIDCGLSVHLLSHDIFMAGSGVIAMLTVYAIILATIFWFFKRKLEEQ